jgi:CheY-like chemotaxis protein
MPDSAVVLLAEDREDDVLLIRNAFARAHIPNPLYIVRDGDEVISYLKGTGKFANRAEYPLPDLLLLDLKMPRTNGFEVLSWIRSQPSLAALRVLVLTSSDELRDVNQAYNLGANSFLVKPHDFEDFIELSRIIQEYWLHVSKTPETSRPPPNSAERKDSTRTGDSGQPLN